MLGEGEGTNVVGAAISGRTLQPSASLENKKVVFFKKYKIALC